MFEEYVRTVCRGPNQILGFAPNVGTKFAGWIHLSGQVFYNLVPSPWEPWTKSKRPVSVDILWLAVNWVGRSL